ncbi:MAG: PhoH family protein [Prolixibacteraceae bacterium]|nr:PhoH family protein [Prolixibacteraceae bacterium]MBT6007140.1 PhoH family protein [Prolixibacteraceae bacterium]MBT7000246.1 PhoH family protein [Prolixibacteraceae bacterium]MBT7394227.1 PhoH family protein [Prolixibacteraceae bacterium]
MDKQILLEGIDPLEFFGINNSKLDLIKKLFPKIKITGRGNSLYIQGEPNEIILFEKKFALILDHFFQFNILTEQTIQEILASGISSMEENGNGDKDIIVFGNNGKPIRGRTPNQRRLFEESFKNDLIFAIGPAGTGKTYTAIALAVKALKNKEIKKIILSRPAVEAGENLGFLPGDLKEKIDPYLQPLYDALQDMIPPKKLEEFMKDGTIQIAPLAFMRGRTLSNAFVILDEAQNTTVNQLKMFLTRMGLNAKFVVTGDVTQIDLPKRSNSGLLHAMKILEKIKSISIIQFDKRDIVRHRLVRDIVDAYEKSKD